MLRRRITAPVFAAVLAFTMVATPASASAPGTVERAATLTGSTGGLALSLRIGDIAVTLADSEGSAAYQMTRVTDTSGGVSESAQTIPVETISGQLAESVVSGLLVPGLSSAVATCNAAKASDEKVALSIPAPVSAVVAGDLSYVKCATRTDGLPSVLQESGEARLDVTLTQTLVQSVPAVNDALGLVQDSVQGLGDVAAPVDNVLTELQERINAQPVARIKVAPTVGSIKSTAMGLTSQSSARGVTIDLLPISTPILGELSGVAQITIGLADASASVVDGVPNAANRAAVARVKILNILTPNPDDVLLDMDLPISADQTILENTPLQSTIKVASAPAPRRECSTLGEVTECHAASRADSLSISLFDPVLKNGTANALPNVALELASADATVSGSFRSTTTAKPILAAPAALPATGAAPVAGMVSGAGLLVAATVVRRRFRI